MRRLVIRFFALLLCMTYLSSAYADVIDLSQYSDLQLIELKQQIDTELEKRQSKGTVINLNDYLRVSFSGYNHAGDAWVTFDKEKFLLDNMESIAYNKDNIIVYRELYGDQDKSPAKAIRGFFSPQISGYKNLSNGDSVEVVWYVNEEKIDTYFVCDIEYSSEEFIANGLTEATTFDPFEDVSVSFSSIAPYGTAEVNAYDFYGGTYSVYPQDGLSNGDVVTVTYNCDDTYDMIARYGAYPSVYEKTYTVSGIKAFPENMEDFSDSVLEDIETVASDYFSEFSEAPRYGGMVVESYSVEGYAFVIPTVNVGYDDSRFYAVYSVDAQAVYKNQCQDTHYYVVFEFKNPIIENGICSLKTANYSMPWHSTKSIDFSEQSSISHINTTGFSTKDEIEEYINMYTGSRAMLLFQTYKQP